MKKVVLVTILLLAASLIGAAQNTSYVILAPNGSDYCSNDSVQKSSVAVATTTSAGTYKIVSGVAGKNIYVCGLVASIAGTNPTFQFVAGTKVSTECDTGATNQSGAIASTAGVLFWDTGRLIAQGVTSKDLCITTAGTTPSLNGTLIYVIW
jgi:hypothetical protein